MNFNRFPFIRFSVAFILGVVVYHYNHEWLNINWVLPAFLFIIYCVLVSLSSLRYQFVLSILAFSIFFCLGFLRLQVHRVDNQSKHLLNVTDTIQAYKAVVYEEPAVKANSINLRLQVTSVLSESWSTATGYVNTYVDKKAGENLKYGDVILVKGAPAVTEPPANPGEFNFKNYLVYNNIFHQQFIGENFQSLATTCLGGNGLWQSQYKPETIVLNY